MAKPPPIPDTEDMRRTLLEKFEEHRKAIIGGVILLGVLIVGVILYVVMSRQRSAENWHDLQQAATGQTLLAERTLEDLVERGGSDLRANALLSLAATQYEQGRYEETVKTLETFEEEYGDDFLGTLDSPTKYSLSQEIRRRAQAELAWQQTYRFEEVEPDRSRLALVETTKGDFWIAFFPEEAPEHVENFIAQALKGEFNGTKVYGVTPTHLLLSGEATRDDDPANDDEPELVNLQEPERGRFWLEHERGRVSSVAWPEGESKLRFTVVVSPTGAPTLNKRQTVFGEVVRDKGPGLGAVDAIRNVVTYGTAPNPEYREAEYANLADHPVTPIVIERVSIWSDGKIEPGHEWDTSAVTEPVAEEAAGGAEEGNGTEEAASPGENGPEDEASPSDGSEDGGSEETGPEDPGGND